MKVNRVQYTCLHGLPKVIASLGRYGDGCGRGVLFSLVSMMMTQKVIVSLDDGGVRVDILFRMILIVESDVDHAD